MPDTVYDVLTTARVTAHVVVPDDIQVLLRALELDGPATDLGAGITTGSVRLVGTLGQSPIPGFDFALVLPDPGARVPYRLQLDPAGDPRGFRFWLELAAENHVAPAFEFVRSSPGFVLTGARRGTPDADGSVELEPLDAADPHHTPRLISTSQDPGSSLTPALLVSAAEGSVAELRFTPFTGADDLIWLGLDPPAVVFGASRVGVELATVIIDDSTTRAVPPEQEPTVPAGAPAPWRDPGWRGLLVPSLTFWLPASVPLFGGRPIAGHLAIGRGHGGSDLVLETAVPPRETEPRRPGFQARIECRDPTASGLSGLVPTLISATMVLPLDGATSGFDAGDAHEEIAFSAGRPVTATLTLSRDPLVSPDAFRVAVGVSAQGDDGLLAVTAQHTDGAKIFTVAAALASALIADRNVAHDVSVGDTAGVGLAGLLAAGGVLSSLFEDDSSFVLHGVEIEAAVAGAQAGEIVLTLDYSVAVRVKGVVVGALSLSMDEDQPLRIRIRKARMALNPHAAGLAMIKLDFDRSGLEVEDPGHWDVGGLQQLFDVLRSRSGRGSMWFEVDLGFKIDLGPITVTGATVRITAGDGPPAATLRGLAAAIDIPGAITGSGGLRVLEPAGFDADLQARVLPLNLGVAAHLTYRPGLVVLGLAVDLPAPIPLANSGFGLLGIDGQLGFSARPDYDSVHAGDPVSDQLRWDETKPWAAAPGQSSFGFGAAVGTLPDLGFTFSAKAGVLITVPDVAVRASLAARLLQPPARVTDHDDASSGAGVRAIGFLNIDDTALDFAVLGTIDLSPLLTVRLPISGRFPLAGGNQDVSDWYLYLGADGAPRDGRATGPISALVLPGIMTARADAYLMIRGHGIVDWPHHKPAMSVPDGLVIAFGFALQTTIGLQPVLWVDLHAALDVLLGSKPVTLAGFGQAGGGLHLGPFSIGVESQFAFLHTDDVTCVRASVTGRVKLLFVHIGGTITITFGDHPPAPQTLPPPAHHPLDRADDPAKSLASLTDDSYAVLANPTPDPATAPAVWPDAVISLPFAVSPAIGAAAGSQFPGVQGPGAPPPSRPLGTEMLHYTWRLEDVTLRDVTFESDKQSGPGLAVPGTLAASWQVPRNGSTPDVAELLLLSPQSDLWVNRTADGGVGLPGGGPLIPPTRICTDGPPDPRPGWAIGFLAQAANPGYRLPSDPFSVDPLECRVDARLHHEGLLPDAPGSANRHPVPLDGLPALPAPYRVLPAALHAWPSSTDVADHPFRGHLLAPTLHGYDENPGRARQAGSWVGQQIGIELDEPVTDIVVVLAIDPAVLEPSDVVVPFGVRSFADAADASGTSLDPEGPVFSLPDGVGVYMFKGFGQAGRVEVSCSLGVEIGVVGLGGITVSAAVAVDRERAMRAAEAARRQQAAHDGLPQPTPPVGPAGVAYRRTVLTPGRLYRIGVDMAWSGRLVQQRSGGGTDVMTVDYGQATTQQRRLFFRTVGPAAAGVDPPSDSDAGFAEWLTPGHPFHPAMLRRYLAGSEPAQGEEFRFRNDPLRIHFRQGHVAALVAAFGARLQVAVRRVDRPGDDSHPVQSWSAITNPDFLDPIDRLRHDAVAAAPCPGPLPGQTISVDDPELAELAWYDLRVVTLRNDGTSWAALPGTTFRTSRWRTPAEMLAGLGFTVTGLSTGQVMNGDLEIGDPAPVAGTAVLGDDQAFDRALVDLGVVGWPAADEVRLSRLWTQDEQGGCRFAGLIVESPEPIERPGRVQVVGLSATNVLGSAVAFGLCRRDRAGHRLLFLTGTPLPVDRTGPHSPVLPGPAITPALTMTLAGVDPGTLPLPWLPPFAGDPR